MQSVEELNSFLTSLLVVALSEEVGFTDDNTSVPAQACLQSINDCIKGVYIEESDDIKYEISSISDDFDYEEISLSWQEWSNEVYTNADTLALKSRDGNIVNAFYNPKAAQKIKDLIKNLSLWTGIMRPYFKAGMEIATSSSVESIFAEYKSRLFKGCIPMRVDKLVINHLEYLDGRLRLDFAAEQEFQISPKPNLQKSASSINDVSFLHSTSIDENTNKSMTSTTKNSDDNEKAIVISELSENLDNDKEKVNVMSDLSENSNDKETVYAISDLSENSDNSLNYKENWMGLVNKDTKKYSIKKKHI
ncbi:kda protein in nof-fb transposable element [Lasius niger]|uniref:KDa protein in nof-fb transposable element n=1 Tax=Lasius niger TaxID=67767 RepID=A0A0J7MZS6_LASNI|nr:kda protein in nof-fb transposable element [Lasius niger]